MKPLFIAGNWKSNKTISESEDWIQKFNAKCQTRLPDGQVLSAKWDHITVVLCAPFTFLYFLKQEISRLRLPVQLSAQDVSPYGDGAYTGAVSARMLKEVSDWVIIGHSERRKYFGETDEVLGQKVVQAKTVGLRIIYCVPDAETIVPQGVDVVAYEPVWAIGTGKSDSPQNANHVVTTIKKKIMARTVIYGGSVTAENVQTFVAQSAIDGVLPGGASLDASKFAALIQSASRT